MAEETPIGSPPTTDDPRTHGRRYKSEPPDISQLFSTSNVLEDEAEETLVRVLEERKQRANSRRQDWVSSVEGERPPLSRVSFHGENVFEPPGVREEEEAAEPHHWARDRFADLAMKVRAMKAKQRRSDEISRPSPSQRSDRSQSWGSAATEDRMFRATSPPRLKQVREDTVEEEGQEVSGVFHGVAGDTIDIGRSEFSLANTDADRLINAAIAVDRNFVEDDGDTASIATEDSPYSEFTEGERLPLVGGESDDVEGRRRKRAARRKWRRRRKRCLKRIKKTCCMSKGNRLSEVLHPSIVFKAFIRFLTSSCFVRIGVPCLLAAFVLFYYMGNPTFDFADKATGSWWLVFVARQCLTLELAHLTEFFLIDGLALRSRWVVRLFGPLLTLFLINSKGMPFLATSKS